MLRPIERADTAFVARHFLDPLVQRYLLCLHHQGPGVLILQRNQAAAALDAAAADVGAQVPVLPLVTADYATAAAAITEEAARQGADLIVMATRGHGAVQRWLLGSVAAAVVRAAETPIILVPPSGQD